MILPFLAYIKAFKSGCAGEVRLGALSQSFIFATADGSRTHSITLRYPVGKFITVDWGDEFTETKEGDDNTTNIVFSHTYGEVGDYDVTMLGDYKEITLILATIQALSGDISPWSNVFSKLTYLRIYANNFTGDMSGFHKMLAGTSATFEIQENNLSFENSAAWTGINTNIKIQDNNMSSSDIDNALIAFSGGAFVNRTLTMNGNNAARTLLSDEAIALLESNGNTVLVNVNEIPLDTYDLTDAGYSSAQIDTWLIALNAADLSNQLLIITGNGAPTDASLEARTAMGLRFVVIEN